jgi:hypothetical protein
MNVSCTDERVESADDGFCSRKKKPIHVINQDVINWQPKSKTLAAAAARSNQLEISPLIIRFTPTLAATPFLNFVLERCQTLPFCCCRR